MPSEPETPSYVLVRRDVPLCPHRGNVYKRLFDEAEKAYRIINDHGIETEPKIVATADNARYGPLIDTNGIPESLQRELAGLGFYLEGPFKDAQAALKFWNNGSKD